MGNSLSPLLSAHLKNQYFINDNPQILHWFRQVDDVWVIVKGTNIDASKILTKLNGVHPSIKFSLELEIHHIVNFLALTEC